jgi:hypothetical protein
MSMTGRSFVNRRILVTALSAASLFLAFGAAANDELPEAPVALACTPPIKCCRVCTSGKACGNTCIQETKACNKGKGCACNASDVCAEDP